LSPTAIGSDVLSANERDLILQAMAECCAERGYLETELEAVIERAGVERKSFESHFTGKEDCALAALNSIVSETLAEVSTARHVESEAERRVFQIKAILELMRARGAFARLIFIAARQGASERMADGYRSAAHVLALMMERAQGTGPVPPPKAGRAALGGAEALVRRELVAGKDRDLTRLLPDFVYAALVPFAGQREALRQSKLARQVIAEEE